MKAYTLTNEDFTKEANTIKEVFLKSMVKAGEIPQEQADKMNMYCVIAAEKGFFGKFWDKIWGVSPNDTFYKVVKVLE